jgi:hypothetical protein
MPGRRSTRSGTCRCGCCRPRYTFSRAPPHGLFRTDRCHSRRGRRRSGRFSTPYHSGRCDRRHPLCISHADRMGRRCNLSRPGNRRRSTPCRTCRCACLHWRYMCHHSGRVVRRSPWRAHMFGQTSRYCTCIRKAASTRTVCRATRNSICMAAAGAAGAAAALCRPLSPRTLGSAAPAPAPASAASRRRPIAPTDETGAWGAQQATGT